MRLPRTPLCTLVLLLVGTCGFSQTSIELKEVRRLVLFFETVPGAQFTQQQQTLLYESLVAKLSNVSEKVAMLGHRETVIPAGDQEKTAVAESIGADSWLYVAVGGDLETAHLEARCLDLLNGIIAFELDLEKETIRGTRELGLLFWHEVEEEVRNYFEQALNIENTIGDLTFQAVPGTRIRGLGSGRLKAEENGSATAQVPLPSTTRFRATRPGYWPVEGQIYMDQPEKTVILEQAPGSRASVDFYLNNCNFPGFDFNFFLLPDMVFVRAGILTHLFGFVLEEEERDFFVSYTLSRFNLGGGIFLNAPDRFVRPYLSAGAFWRIITARGYWGLEPISPFGMQPIFGCEYSRQSRYKLFLEYAPMVYWTGDRDSTLLFLLSIPANNDFSGYLPFKWCVIDLVNFKLGLRIRL
jgi:hypothetical protein